MSTTELPSNAQISIFSRNEKKAREMIQKLGLKQIQGVSRVTFRKKNNQIFAIDRPEVFKSPGGNYVVFGEAKVDDFTRRLARVQQQAAAAASKDPQSIQADMVAAASENGNNEKDSSSSVNAPLTTDEDDTTQADDSGLDAADIELVMQQASVSRNKAIKALREHNSDIVNAIMSLSK